VANATDILTVRPRNDARNPSSERWNYVGERVSEFFLNDDFHAV